LTEEPAFRGKGLGKLVVEAMMKIGTKYLGIATYTAKISDTNSSSIRLFKDKLGFKQISYSEMFKEVTLELHVDQEFNVDNLTEFRLEQS